MFQTHGLAAELERICISVLGLAALVFYGIGLPQAVPVGEGNSLCSPAVFQNVALPADAQLCGIDADATLDQQVAPAFLQRPVMRPFMHQRAIHSAVIFSPLVFNVDQRPLAAAKGEMLQAGQLEEVLLLIDHPMRVQVTPAGRWSSSTSIS